jgi:hypothetical protein
MWIDQINRPPGIGRQAFLREPVAGLREQEDGS